MGMAAVNAGIAIITRSLDAAVAEINDLRSHVSMVIEKFMKFKLGLEG
jgi:hypothetical protein